MKKDNNWYWAAHVAPRSLSVGKFIIEKGQDALFRRCRVDMGTDDNIHWMMINSDNKEITISDILNLVLAVMITYQISQNAFMFEAAKIPVFAEFLKNGKVDICNYVSNSMFKDNNVVIEPYDHEAMIKLGKIVSETLGCDADWF